MEQLIEEYAYLSSQLNFHLQDAYNLMDMLDRQIDDLDAGNDFDLSHQGYDEDEGDYEL